MNLNILEDYSGIYGVYQIKNTKTSKIYIGSTEDIKRRLMSHYHCLIRGVHCAAWLQHSFNRHGETCFEISVLEVCESMVNLVSREQYYLDTLLFAQEYIRGEDDRFKQLGYNVVPIAGRTTGYKHTEKTLSSLSEQSMLLWQNKKYRTKTMANRKVNGYTGYNKLKSKRIVVYLASTGEFVAEYESVSGAHKSLKVSGFFKVLLGKIKQSKGYVAKPFVENYPLNIEPIKLYRQNEECRIKAVDEAMKAKAKKIVQLNLRGDRVTVHGSYKEAAAALNLKEMAIYRGVTLKRVVAGVYRFEYL